MAPPLPWKTALAHENHHQARLGLLVTLVLALLGGVLRGGSGSALLSWVAAALTLGFLLASGRTKAPWFVPLVLHVLQVGIIASDRFDQVLYPWVFNELGYWMMVASLFVLGLGEAVLLYGLGVFLACGSLLTLDPAPPWLALNLGQVVVAAGTSFAVSRFHYLRRVEFHRQHESLAVQAVVLAEAQRQNLVLQAGVRWGLTARETEVLGLVVAGLGNGEVAERLFVSVDTVKKHLSHIFQKSGTKGRFQLVRAVESPENPYMPVG